MTPFKSLPIINLILDQQSSIKNPTQATTIILIVIVIATMTTIVIIGGFTIVLK